MLSDGSDQLPKRFHGLAIMHALVASIGLLVFFAVGSVLVLQWMTGRSVIDDFAGRLIAQGLATQERTVRDELQVAVDDETFIADAIKAGRYSLFDKSFEDFAVGTFAAAPEIGGLIVVAADGKTLRLVRGKQPSDYKLDYIDSALDERLADALREADQRRTPDLGSARLCPCQPDDLSGLSCPRLHWAALPGRRRGDHLNASSFETGGRT